jgi:hypothetical protein
MLLKL